MNEELKSTKKELKRRKIEEERMTKEISECQRELKQTKIELDRKKSENNEYVRSIIVGCDADDNRLGENRTINMPQNSNR